MARAKRKRRKGTKTVTRGKYPPSTMEYPEGACIVRRRCGKSVTDVKPHMRCPPNSATGRETTGGVPICVRGKKPQRIGTYDRCTPPKGPKRSRCGVPRSKARIGRRFSKALGG